MAANASSLQLTDDDRQLVDKLVTANHILYTNGVLDAFGHASVRSHSNPDEFFLSRNLAPIQVRAHDIQRLTLDAETSDERRSYLERFIHAEIYRARPDVQGIVHSHSPAVLPFSISTTTLKPVSHMAGFLPQDVPVFEIRDFAGLESDLLIRNAALGRALAGILGESSVALMRGHGSTAVGSSIEDAVFRAVYTEMNARVQQQALSLGPVTHLTAAEADSAAASNASQIKRAWDSWASSARALVAENERTSRDTP